MSGTAPASPTSLVPAISARTVDLFSGAGFAGAEVL
jgi:hypothetical protein